MSEHAQEWVTWDIFKQYMDEIARRVKKNTQIKVCKVRQEYVRYIEQEQYIMSHANGKQ